MDTLCWGGGDGPTAEFTLVGSYSLMGSMGRESCGGTQLKAASIRISLTP